MLWPAKAVADGARRKNTNGHYSDDREAEHVPTTDNSRQLPPTPPYNEDDIRESGIR